MDIFDTCFNCGQQCHYAGNCPSGINITPPRGNHPPRWRPPPRRPAEEQARINEQGIALCRAALRDRIPA
jgi:hypothetical protein